MAGFAKRARRARQECSEENRWDDKENHDVVCQRQQGQVATLTPVVTPTGCRYLSSFDRGQKTY